MNPIKTAACGLLLALPVAYSNIAMAGSIIIGKEDGAVCALPLPTPPATYVRYNLRRSSYPCHYFNDNVLTITFLKVPSATRVTLSNYEGSPEDNSTDGRCTASNLSPGLITIKTIKKQTSTKNIELQHLQAYTPGQIIEPGLQMVAIEPNSDLRDKLSCVQIEVSEAAPTTSTP